MLLEIDLDGKLYPIPPRFSHETYLMFDLFPNLNEPMRGRFSSLEDTSKSQAVPNVLPYEAWLEFKNILIQLSRSRHFTLKVLCSHVFP